MSKNRTIFILIFLMVFLLPNQTSNAAPTYAVISKGDSGKTVTDLQSNLNTLGFFNMSPTGYFGTITQAATKSFQKRFGLDSDGVAGYFTHSEIDRQLDKTFKSSTSTQIVIDPGHGGGDPGASMKGVIEKEINLDISKKLKAVLTQSGHSSILTRTTDTSLFGRGETLVEKDLSGRARIINRNNAKLFVSVHANSMPGNSSASGAIVFYYAGSEKSKILAQSIQKQLNSISINGDTRVQNRIQTANFYVLRFSNIPGVLVETGFVTNSIERNALSQQLFREQTANAIKTGIENSGLID